MGRLTLAIVKTTAVEPIATLADASMAGVVWTATRLPRSLNITGSAGILPASNDAAKDGGAPSGPVPVADDA